MLVIFDCDGVLVDSEHLASQVFSEQLAKIGVAKSPSICFAQFKGHTLLTCMNMLRIDEGLSIPNTFLDDLSEATQEAFATQLKAVDGVESVLKVLTDKAIAFCVASNGGIAKVHHSLRVTNLLSYFDSNCFSAEFVARGKPDPDLFLWAAEKMGYLPEQSIVIEDSPTGVAAGVSAGMKVMNFVGVAEKTSPFYSSPSSRVNYFTNMDQLLGLLELEGEIR